MQKEENKKKRQKKEEEEILSNDFKDASFQTFREGYA